MTTLIAFTTPGNTPGDIKAWFRDDIGKVLTGLVAARAVMPAADQQFEAGYRAALISAAIVFGLTPIQANNDLDGA